MMGLKGNNFYFKSCFKELQLQEQYVILHIVVSKYAKL